MNMHKNARLTPKGREILIGRLERGEHACDVARALEIAGGLEFVQTAKSSLTRHWYVNQYLPQKFFMTELNSSGYSTNEG